MSKKEVKNPRTETQNLLCIIRKKMNVVTEEELNKKNYVCTFDKKTHKLSSIKAKSNESISTNNDDDSNIDYKKKFYLLIEDIEKYYHRKITLTASKRLRCMREISCMPKPKPRPRKNKNKDAEQNNIVEQKTQEIANNTAVVSDQELADIATEIIAEYAA